MFIYLRLGTLPRRSVYNVYISKVGYSTKEKCTTWPREVCTVNKQLKKKNNPTTKCEKVKALFIHHTETKSSIQQIFPIATIFMFWQCCFLRTKT